MNNIADHYIAVNAAWPPELPPISSAEARRAYRRLTRHFHVRTSRVSPRRCWVAITPPFNSLNRGWRRLVHDVSHSAWSQQSPSSRQHHRHHSIIERAMVEYVVGSGWLTGTLKTKALRQRPTPAEVYATLLDRIGRWATRRKRAETAILKLRRRARYYERRMKVATEVA